MKGNTIFSTERLRELSKSVAPSEMHRACGWVADEISRLRTHLAELGKAADAAAMVIATIEAEDTTEEEGLQKIMDAIGQWAPGAIMGPNVQHEGRPEGVPLDAVVGRVED